MDRAKIDRINELARIARERELTEEETLERHALRKEYIASVTGNLRVQLDNTYVVDEDGNKVKAKEYNEKRRG